jgi:LPXTG-site transpeptidase (sortase) family protein
MTITGMAPEDAEARSGVTPTGSAARPKVTASPEVIAKLLRSDDLFKPTRAERNARMPSPLRVMSTALNILAIMLLGMAVYFGFVSALHHDRAQLTSYANFRTDLALATAPVGAGRPDDPTQPLVPGTPVAVLEISKLGLKEVVFEGTTGSVLENGPGHLRTTPLPGQPGTSVVMGRSTLYGGPFARIGQLAPDDTFTVTTGQGVHTYKVLGVRRPGELQPPPLAAGQGRLTLVTAAGNPFVPSDVIRVDADLTSDAQPRPARQFGQAGLSHAEQPMGTERIAWVFVVVFGAALVVAASVAGWTRYAWGGPQTWLVAVPVLTMLGIAIGDQVARLLPNLI